MQNTSVPQCAACLWIAPRIGMCLYGVTTVCCLSPHTGCTSSQCAACLQIAPHIAVSLHGVPHITASHCDDLQISAVPGAADVGGAAHRLSPRCGATATPWCHAVRRTSPRVSTMVCIPLPCGAACRLSPRCGATVAPCDQLCVRRGCGSSHLGHHNTRLRPTCSLVLRL